VKKEEKLKKALSDQIYIKKITTDFEKNKKVINLTLYRDGQPVNYVRERYTGRGHRFYNAKAGTMNEINKQFIKDVNKLPEGPILKKLIDNPESTYYVSLEADFYVKTPNGDSVEKTVLKENKVILPAIAPDTDNYIKLIIDTLHNVIFDDDKRVVSIIGNKYYSLSPRTEVRVKVEIIDEKEEE
jgi:Holliday junction resolvase RusA-like endonuclease